MNTHCRQSRVGECYRVHRRSGEKSFLQNILMVKGAIRCSTRSLTHRTHGAELPEAPKLSGKEWSGPLEMEILFAFGRICVWPISRWHRLLWDRSRKQRSSVGLWSIRVAKNGWKWAELGWLLPARILLQLAAVFCERMRGQSISFIMEADFIWPVHYAIRIL